MCEYVTMGITRNNKVTLVGFKVQLLVLLVQYYMCNGKRAKTGIELSLLTEGLFLHLRTKSVLTIIISLNVAGLQASLLRR
jgi:hypothetical protein